MSANIVLTVGNSLMGDDAAGPLLAARLGGNPADGWNVIDGGSTPENYVHAIRARQPPVVLVVDAAEMGLAAGEIRTLTENQVAAQFIMTTHNLPLVYLLRMLAEFVPQVVFVGIQPELVAFDGPVSPQIHAAVETIHAELCAGRYTYPLLSG